MRMDGVYLNISGCSSLGLKLETLLPERFEASLGGSALETGLLWGEKKKRVRVKPRFRKQRPKNGDRKAATHCSRTDRLVVNIRYSFTEHLRFRRNVVFRVIGGGGGAEARCASFSSIETAVLKL